MNINHFYRNSSKQGPETKVENTMEKKLIVFIMYACSVLVLQGCNTLSLGGDKLQKGERVSAEVDKTDVYQARTIQMDLNQHLQEWYAMKPSLERLVAIESELKELIAQLTGMAPPAQTTPAVAQQDSVYSPSTVSPAYVTPEKNYTADPQQVIVAAPSFQVTTPLPPKVIAVVPKIVVPQIAVPEVAVPSVVIPSIVTPSVAVPEIAVPMAEAPNVVVSKPAGPVVTADYGLQLASIRSKSKLKVSWKRLVDKHPILLGTLQPIYEKKMVNNMLYYRVKAGGFSTRKAAINLCEKLFARDTQCILTTYTGIAF